MPKTLPPPWFEKHGIRIADFGRELRGLGGLQTTHVRPFKGATFGAASRGRRLTDAERRQVEDQLRRDGKL